MGGLEEVAALAGAFARQGLRNDEVVNLVLGISCLPSSSSGANSSNEDAANRAEAESREEGPPLRAHEDSLANLALFCHTFEVLNPDQLRWFVPRVSSQVQQSKDVGTLAKALPLLSAARDLSECLPAPVVAAADAAIREVVDTRLAELLASPAGGISANQSAKLLKALAASRERNLELILSLSSRCIRSAAHLDAPD